MLGTACGLGIEGSGWVAGQGGMVVTNAHVVAGESDTTVQLRGSGSRYSAHAIWFDPFESTNPWSPWLGIWVAITRRIEGGTVLNPDEALTREQALRLYTINNAYLNHEEKEKGSLEAGKLGDLILIDRDVLTCPVDAVRDTKVLLTVLGGRVVYERK